MAVVINGMAENINSVASTADARTIRVENMGKVSSSTKKASGGLSGRFSNVACWAGIRDK